MLICGIDPGKTGYLVKLCTGSNWAKKLKLEFDKDGVLDYQTVNDFLFEDDINLILLEKISGRGGFGATQTFNSGSAFGQIKLLLSMSKLRHRMVLPSKWQDLIHEGVSPKLKPKERSYIAYKQLLPHGPIRMTRGGNVDHNLVDALLIAVYGVFKYGRSELKAWTFQ